MEKITEQFNNFLNVLAKHGAFFGILAGLVPASLIIYTGYIFMIEPAMRQIESQEKQVAAAEAEVVKGKAVEASQEEFKREFKKTVELFYESLPLIPVESELSNILTGVQNVAVRNNVVLTGLVAVKIGQKTANADKLYEREMPATVVGSYDDCMRFFLDLSRQTRILIVRDYTAQTIGEKKGARPEQVSVDFSLLAYHAPPTSEFPNVPAEFKSPAPQSANNLTR